MWKEKEVRSPGFQVVLGQRQLAAVLFMSLIIVGLLTSIAYMAGRITTPVHADSDSNPAPKGPQQTIVVDPAKSPCGDGAMNRLSAPKPSVAEASPSAPAAPQHYLQVVATDRPRADSTAAFLAARGLPSRVIPGPNEVIFRVLVGPLSDAVQSERIRSTLAQAGFPQPLSRMY
ncbi:MAG: SPOR domain-containing protein [Bryobacteraceae bacterium]